MPTDVLQRLREGNARFVAGEPPRVRADPRSRDVKQGRAAFAAVLACSDARAPVEFVFDQGVGDLFVVRTAGNTAGGHEVASLAFAVGVLKTPVVVVMGHTDCGAIRAAVCPEPSFEELGPIIEEIAAAADRVPGADRVDPDQAVIDAVARSHVGDVIQLLIDRSAVIREAVADGTCRVVGALYDTGTGRVDFIDDAADHRPCITVLPARARRARPGR